MAIRHNADLALHEQETTPKNGGTDESLRNRQERELKKAKRELRALRPARTAPRYDLPYQKWFDHTEGADPELRAWCLDGVANGFDIYVRDDPALERAKVKNLPMTLGQKLFFTIWTIAQFWKQALWGPFKIDQSDVPTHLRPLRVNPQGCVRKGNHFGVREQDKKWRPINHQSHPRSGMSVNSQVQPEWATVSYIQFREIVALMEFAGVGAEIWAVDAADAFLRVPIKERCMRHMAFIIHGTLWFFTSLCFGLASAPRIYTLFADMTLWIIRNKRLPGHERVEWRFEGRELVHHYVDDFFGIVPVRSDISAKAQFDLCIAWFKELGIPTTPKKVLAPNTSQVILGFLYDTDKQMVFIPPLKLRAYCAAIDRILNRRTVSKQEVLSLIGKLRWASACVTAGPAFVRRLEEYANRTRRLIDKVKTGPLRADLIWWRAQIKRAAVGIPFKYILTPRDGGDVHVLTDASTGDGMGGWTKGAGDWFRYRWSDHPRADIFAPAKGKAPDIFWKEMCGVVTAALIWGHKWKGQAVTFHCDNMSSVWTLIKKACSHERKDIMHMVRVFMTVANEHGFHPYIVHIKGKDNVTADALSRFMKKKFWSDTDGTTMAEHETESVGALDAIVGSTWPLKRGRKRRFCEL